MADKKYVVTKAYSCGCVVEVPMSKPPLRPRRDYFSKCKACLTKAPTLGKGRWPK